MDIDLFESMSLEILLTTLCVFMGFIVYDLAKKSKAGKLGLMVLLGVLCLGVLGFIFKIIMMYLLN